MEAKLNTKEIIPNNYEICNINIANWVLQIDYKYICIMKVYYSNVYS
jgi:hypothetical protein